MYRVRQKPFQNLCRNWETWIFQYGMGEVVYLLRYVPNMGAILNLSLFFFKWKGGRVIYQITLAFSAKFIPVNRFEVAVMVQKLQHILLQVTEGGFDHRGENWSHFDIWRRSFRVITADFNNRHPQRLPILHNALSCLISKFRETGTWLSRHEVAVQKVLLTRHTVSHSPRFSEFGN